MQTPDQIYEAVAEYYGQTLQQTKDLKTSACTTASAPPKAFREALTKVPSEIVNRFYGCGNPVPLGIAGLHVVDLGSGSGRDCYVASQFVGPNGFVTGIDMTDEQLEIANRFVEPFTKSMGYGKPNLRFVKGYIEFLEKAGIAPNTIDLIISNCVVNLSPNKEQVLRSAYNVLKQGGEMHFSDVYCDRRLPEHVRQHKVLYGECISGALYVNDFISLCKKVGFEDPRVLSISPISVSDEELKDIVGNARFFSITYRLFKLPDMDPQCEDYGQLAIYKGTIPNDKFSYKLDDHHMFITGKPALVCGNTASMLGETWLRSHFQIVGDRSVHYGVFDCSSGSTSAPTPNKSDSNTTSCCSNSGMGCG